jgi:adenylate cyclase
VLIVDIDEASLSAYGNGRPRTLVARLLIGFSREGEGTHSDVVFSRPTDRPQEAMRFVDLDDATRVRLQNMPSNDDILAKAMTDRKVVLGQSGSRTIGTDSTERPPQTGIAILGPDPGAFLYSFPKMLRNLPQLERAAAGRGLFTIATERDGMVRRVPLVMSADGRVVPALAIDLLRVATGAGAVLVRADQAGVQQVSVAGLQLPTDENGRVWVHFSPHSSARYVSAKDVLEGAVSPQQLAEKLVLIGTSAIGLLDIKTTPVHAAMPGVEIHAQLVEAALSGSLLKAPSYAIAVEITIAALVGAMLALLAPVVGAVALSLLAFLGLAALSAGSWVLYSNYQILIDPSFPAIAVLAAYMGLMLIGYFLEQADRRRIRSAFSQYLSPNLVEQLASSPQKLVLGGEERNMTVLFSDVRGFTAIAESFGDNPHGLHADDRFHLSQTRFQRVKEPSTNTWATPSWHSERAARRSPPRESCQHAALEMLEQVDCHREREREGRERNPFHPHQSWHRHQHWPVRRRQHGFDRDPNTPSG